MSKIGPATFVPVSASSVSWGRDGSDILDLELGRRFGADAPARIGIPRQVDPVSRDDLFQLG